MIEDVCRLPIDFHVIGTKTLIQLMEDAGYFESPSAVTESAIESCLAKHPEFCDAWIGYSQDRRTDSGWVIDEQKGLFMVYYYPNGSTIGMSEKPMAGSDCRAELHFSIRKRLTPVRLLTKLLAVWLGLLGIETELMAVEPLDNYVGAWLFRDDRKQVWTGAEDAKTGGVVLYEQCKAICGPVQKLWTVRFDSPSGKYIGTLKTTFQQETHETVIFGEWDQAASTMTWTLKSDALQYAKIRHRFLKGKLVVTALRQEHDPIWHELGILSPTAR